MTETSRSEATNHTDKNEKAPSDARIILGPLVKYAAMGLVLVSVILTTAIMMDRQLNDIEREVAALQAELTAPNRDSAIQAEAAEEHATPAVVETDTKQQATETPAPASPALPANAAETPGIKAGTETSQDSEKAEATEDQQTGKQETDIQGEVEAVVDTQTPVEPAIDNRVADAESTDAESGSAATVFTQTPLAVVENEAGDPFVRSIEAAIAERNAYLRQMDLIRLEQYRAIQEKQLQYMRERLARQEQRIKEMEARFRQRYQDRAGNLKELQQMRESYRADRI